MRKTRLVDCNPRWGTRYGEHDRAFITFECPEGHSNCRHTIPFTPTLNGHDKNEQATAVWQRTGDTFENLTLSPSIRRTRGPNDCRLHILIRNGGIEFCGDSR